MIWFRLTGVSSVSAIFVIINSTFPTCSDSLRTVTLYDLLISIALFFSGIIFGFRILLDEYNQLPVT